MEKVKGLKLRKIRVDGYKNLVDCTVEFDDLTVLVGPNNSGKTNFLEVFPLVFGLLYGQEAYDPILDDNTSRRLEPFFCNLPKYKRKDLQVEIHFQCPIGKTTWDMCYKLVIARDAGSKSDDFERLRFKRETIEGKPPNRPGPATVFLKRDDENLTVTTGGRSKTHHIGTHISAFEFLRTTYPKGKSLKEELRKVVSGIVYISRSNVLALSPELLRLQMSGTLGLSAGLRIFILSIPLLIDNITKDTK